MATSTKKKTGTAKKTASAKKSTTGVTVEFAYEKDTKNKFRFQEQHDDGVEAVIGTLYVSKSAFPKGAPKSLTITLS